MMLTLMSLMPVRMLDWVMARFIGTTKKRLTAPASGKSATPEARQAA
jgi:hypothetical protein